MNILLAFAPFLVFALVDRVVGTTAGLACGAIVSAALIIREVVSKKRNVKVLEVGTVILFGGLTAYSLIGQVNWSIVGVRLCVDSGLLAIVLISMAVRLPLHFAIRPRYSRKGPLGSARVHSRQLCNHRCMGRRFFDHGGGGYRYALRAGCADTRRYLDHHSCDFGRCEVYLMVSVQKIVIE